MLEKRYGRFRYIKKSITKIHDGFYNDANNEWVIQP